MKTKQLTKREQQIMEIIWDSEKDLSANEIKTIAGEISIYTIQQVLKKLLKMNYIEVAGIGYTKNSITRKFKPIITQAEYIDSCINSKTRLKLATNFIRNNSDSETLDYLEKLIKEKRNNLKE